MNVSLLNFRETSLVLGSNLANSKLLNDACTTRSIVILADAHVAQLYGEKLCSYLQQANRDVFLIAFPEGESSKSRETKAQIEDQMFSKGLMRDTTLIALGGGVTTDLAGFIASTYCRGIPFISMPTSLLGMVDASLGGKNGINTSYGKNLIGAFYLPKTLIIDFDFLKTLNPEQVKEGLVEVIKKALLLDAHLFKEIEDKVNQYLTDIQSLPYLIKKACEMKLEVIDSDLEEKQGRRRILNLGHTVAHAIECDLDYTLTHGEAVACGIIVESFISTEMDLLPRHDLNRIVTLFKPFIQKRNLNPDSLYEKMALDKKSHQGVPRFVLLKGIGEVCSFGGEYCTAVEKDLILNALAFLHDL